MKVILLKDVKNVGKVDQIVTVSDGYATNFLLPRKLAVQYSSESQSALDRKNENIKKQLEADKAQATTYKQQLEGIVLEFTAKSAPDGRMIGSISYKQIEEELKNKFNVIIDKRRFIDKYPVNAFGTTKLKIELFKDIIGVVNVHVSVEK